MFNTALVVTTIKNFQKNLSKSIDKEQDVCYNKDKEGEIDYENKENI